MRERNVLLAVVMVSLGCGGCALLAEGLRGLAALVESPVAQAAGEAAADAVGLGWIWKVVAGLGSGAGVVAVEGVRRARRNGAFVDVLAGVLDQFKGTDREHVAPILAAITKSMDEAGRGGQFDAFLAKLGRNPEPPKSA